MKKKYLLLLLACLLCTSVFISGCGKNADEPVIEEDDKDGKDDDEDDEPVYIETIDDDDLEDQIDAVIKNSDDWVIAGDSSAPVYAIDYFVTDLDHNGRIEVVSVSRFEYGDMTEVHIHEVDEKCKGIDEAKWKTDGVDVTSDSYPDFDFDYTVLSFRNKKDNTTHYLLDNYFDNGNGEYGISFCDLSYSDGKVTCNVYAAYISAMEVEYYTSDGTEINDDSTFSQYLREHPKRRSETEINFGAFEDTDTSAFISILDDEALKNLLIDSYRVFAGEYEKGEFDKKYNDHSFGVASVEYSDIIGTWILNSSDDGSGTEYYDEYSSHYYVIEYREDRTAVLTVYMDGDLFLKKELSVTDDRGNIEFRLYDPDGRYFDPDIEYVSYVVEEYRSGDPSELKVANIAYDYDGDAVEKYDLVFVRAQGVSDVVSEIPDYYVGVWEMESMELGDQIIYSEDGGQMEATLTVSSDGTVILEEYSYGQLTFDLVRELKEDSTGLLYFDYADRNALSEPIASETFTFFLNMANYDYMDVFVHYYDRNGEFLGSCCITFVKNGD